MECVGALTEYRAPWSAVFEERSSRITDVLSAADALNARYSGTNNNNPPPTFHLVPSSTEPICPTDNNVIFPTFHLENLPFSRVNTDSPVSHPHANVDDRCAESESNFFAVKHFASMMLNENATGMTAAAVNSGDLVDLNRKHLQQPEDHRCRADKQHFFECPNCRMSNIAQNSIVCPYCNSLLRTVAQ